MPTLTTPEQQREKANDEGSIASRTRRSTAGDNSDRTFDQYKGTEMDFRYFLVSCVEQAIKGTSVYLSRPTPSTETLLRETVLKLSHEQLMNEKKDVLLEKVKQVIRPMALQRTAPGSKEPFLFLRALLKEQGPKGSRIRKKRMQESSPKAKETEDTPLSTKKYEQPSLVFRLPHQSDSSSSYQTTTQPHEDDTPKATGATSINLEEDSIPEAQPNDQLVLLEANAIASFTKGSITEDWLRRGSLPSTHGGAEEFKEPPSEDEEDQKSPPVEQVETRHSQGWALDSTTNLSPPKSEDLVQFWKELQTTLERVEEKIHPAIERLEAKEKILDEKIMIIETRERQAAETAQQLEAQIHEANEIKTTLHREVKMVRAIYKDWTNKIESLEKLRLRTKEEIISYEESTIREQVKLMVTRELARAEATTQKTRSDEHKIFKDEVEKIATAELQQFIEKATAEMSKYNEQYWQDIDAARAHVGDETGTIKAEFTAIRQEVAKARAECQFNSPDNARIESIDQRIQDIQSRDWESIVKAQVENELKEWDVDRFYKEFVPNPPSTSAQPSEDEKPPNPTCHAATGGDCGCGPWKADMEQWRSGVDLLQGQMSITLDENKERLERHMENYKNWRTATEDTIRQNQGPTTPKSRPRFYPLWKNQAQAQTTDPTAVTPDPAAYARAENIRHNLRKYQSADVPEVISDEDYDELAVATFYESFRTTAGHYNIELVPLDDLASEGTIESQSIRELPEAIRRSVNETIYNKLQQIVPPEVKSLRSIIDCYAVERDGYKALYSIMQQNCEELKLIPKQRGPQWKHDEDGWRFLGRFKRYLREEERRGVVWTEYQKAVNILQRAMTHPRYETKATAFMAALLTASKDGEFDWSPFEMHRLMGSLEDRNSKKNPIDLTKGDPAVINRFGNGNGNGQRGRSPSPRRPRREVQCEMCHNFGHNIDEDPCRIGAQCFHCLSFIEKHPQKAQQNAKAYTMMNQARTIKQMESQLPHLSQQEREQVIFTLSTAMTTDNPAPKKTPRPPMVETVDEKEQY